VVALSGSNVVALCQKSRFHCINSKRVALQRGSLQMTSLGSEDSSPESFFARMNRVVRFCVASSVALATSISCLPVLADSRLNAPSSAGTRVNSDAESLLRYGLPISNKEIREIQNSIEAAKVNLKTRRIIYAKLDVANVKALLSRYESKLLNAVPSANLVEAKESLENLKSDVVPLLVAIDAESVAGSGSLQERKGTNRSVYCKVNLDLEVIMTVIIGLDDAFDAQKVLSQELSRFEELMVPPTFTRTIPDEFKSLPSLQRRAEVEMTFKKPDGSQYDVEGRLYDSVTVKMVIDGYNAPLTGGNFVDLVSKGFYNGMTVYQIVYVCIWTKVFQFFVIVTDSAL